MESTDELTDEALLTAYLEGDARALNSLVERHQQQLYAYIRSMVTEPADADDTFQEVWMRVMQKAARYRKNNFRGWLMRIARNLVIDRYRRRRPTVSLDARTREGTAVGELLASGDRGPRQEVAGRDVAEFVGTRVAELPLAQREVFVMRTEQDLSFKEIAALQGVSINTALGRMHYAVGRLRQELEQWRDGLMPVPSE